MFEKLLSANLSAALFPAVIVEALGHILHFAQTAREPNPPLTLGVDKPILRLILVNDLIRMV